MRLGLTPFSVALGSDVLADPPSEAIPYGHRPTGLISSHGHGGHAIRVVPPPAPARSVTVGPSKGSKASRAARADPDERILFVFPGSTNGARTLRTELLAYERSRTFKEGVSGRVAGAGPVPSRGTTGLARTGSRWNHDRSCRHRGPVTHPPNASNAWPGASERAKERRVISPKHSMGLSYMPISWGGFGGQCRHIWQSHGVSG